MCQPKRQPNNRSTRSHAVSHGRYPNPKGYIPDSELEVRTTTRESGNITFSYSYKGEQHRDDGPAWVEYAQDGSVKSEYWYQHGEQHRDDGPAVVWYGPDGSVEYEGWYTRGQQHRDDGPAVVWYRPDGSVEHEEWYVDGEMGELPSRR